MRQQITLTVTRVTVVTGPGHQDRICLDLDLPSPYPTMNYPASAQIEATCGYGKTWCKANLGIDPEVIKTT